VPGNYKKGRESFAGWCGCVSCFIAVVTKGAPNRSGRGCGCCVERREQVAVQGETVFCGDGYTVGVGEVEAGDVSDHPDV